jgi:hypothetical protein
MSSNTASRFALAAFAAVAFGAITAPARAQEITGVEVTGRAATTIKINVSGLDRPAVRKVVRVASVEVCDAAVRNREANEFDADWCVRATLDTTMAEYRLHHRADGTLFAAEPDLIVLAAR